MAKIIKKTRREILRDILIRE